jgi:hypothetical protein
MEGPPLHHAASATAAAPPAHPRGAHDFRTLSMPAGGAPPPPPLHHAATAGAAMLQRRGSVGLGGSPTAAGAAKHADVYLTELLSYSLDRLRKVRALPPARAAGCRGRATPRAAVHRPTFQCPARGSLPRDCSSMRQARAAPAACPTPTTPLGAPRQEPELLAEERHQLERALQASALAHYRAFIDGAECLGAVRGALAEALARLEAMQRALPKLSATCESFSKDAAGVLAQRAANKQLLGERRGSVNARLPRATLRPAPAARLGTPLPLRRADAPPRPPRLPTPPRRAPRAPQPSRRRCWSCSRRRS